MQSKLSQSVHVSIWFGVCDVNGSISIEMYSLGCLFIVIVFYELMLYAFVWFMLETRGENYGCTGRYGTGKGLKN